MYHTQIKNQALNTTFSHKDSHTDNYISQCTSTQKKISNYILRYKDYPFIKLSNERIANAVGCSVITVIRTTNKFHKDGFITKYQENRYTSNNYTFGMIVDHKNKKIIQSEYDRPNKNLIFSSLILDKYLFRSPVLVPVHTHVREETHRISKAIDKPRGKKRRKIVNEAMKQMILQNKHSPKTKETLLTPHIWADIITPTIEKISQMFELNRQEQFKLVVFREDVLEHMLEQTETAFEKYKATGYKFRNRLQWLLTVGEEYSKIHAIKVDWPWYYDLCSIFDMSKETPARPFVIQGKSSAKIGHYKGDEQSVWGQMQRHTPLEARVKQWKDEIEKCEKLLQAFPDKGYGGRGYIERIIFNAQRELENAELKLKESNEKQKVLREHESHSMAESSTKQQQILRNTDPQQSIFWSPFESTA